MTEPQRRRPRRWEFTAVRLWHALLAGGFLVAFLTGDEDTYAMHLFSGYLVLAAVAARLLAAGAAPAGSPLKLKGLPQRKPVLTWMAVALIALVGVVAATGAVADVVPLVEDLHEGISEASPWVIGAHVALVWALMGGGRALVARLKRA